MIEPALSINGKRRLFGELSIQGSKNSALPCLTACSLCEKGCCTLANCPNLSDVQNTIEILEELGCTCRYDGNKQIAEINAESFFGDTIGADMMNKMRSSMLFLGTILSRIGEAHIGYPGGCQLGARPIDLHLKAFQELGVSIEESSGMIHCRIKKKLTPKRISLICPSVGATENVMLLMAVSDGETVLMNAAREPEILDLQELLNSMGADIRGGGTDVVVINGVKKLGSAEHKIMPDRIVASTYMAAVTGCGGKILLRDLEPEHVDMCSSVLRDMGAEISSYNKKMLVSMNRRPRAVKTIRTLYYPGFPTDAQPQFMAVSAVARGTTVFLETIFENRFRHSSELNRMGADISVNQCQATVRGRSSLSGAEVMAYDLRGGAAMVIAGLIAEDTTVVRGLEHIERGYCHIDDDLKNLGADINVIF